jgi:integrase
VKGHIETLASGRHRARIGKKTIGTFDRLTQAQAALGIGTLAGWWDDFAVRRRKLVRDWRNEEGRWELYFAHDPIVLVPFPDLSRKHAKAWLDSMLARGLAPQTIRNAIQVGRAVLADAIEAEQLESNPFDRLKVPKRYGVRSGEGFTVLDPDEQLALLDAVDDDEYHLVAFALHTGLRGSELWNLRFEDIDLEAEEVIVRRDKGGFTKTGKSRRLPLIGLARQAAQHAFAHRRCDFVWPSPKTGEKRFDGSHPHRWHAWVKAAGIKRRVRFYDLRHTCATALLAGWWSKAWPITTVQQMLGHSSVKMTERYAHLIDETLSRAGKETVGLDPTRPHENGADSGTRTRDLRFTKPGGLPWFHGVALRRHHEKLANREESEGRLAGHVLRGLKLAREVNAGRPGAAEQLTAEIRAGATIIDGEGIH